MDIYHKHTFNCVLCYITAGRNSEVICNKFNFTGSCNNGNYTHDDSLNCVNFPLALPEAVTTLKESK